MQSFKQIAAVALSNCFDIKDSESKRSCKLILEQTWRRDYSHFPKILGWE